MKRIICVLLCLALTFSLAACGSENSSEKGENNSALNSTAENSKVKSDKTLVVYFSATGNTKDAAEKTAKILGADIFEIVPESPYTSEDLDWRDENSRVSTEHNDESKRDVTLAKTTPDNFDEYGTVYIGYPIWWGIAAWPVSSFVKSNDFTDKTVIPFCTSASSALGDSADLLKQAAGSGNWLEGKRFSSSVSENDIKEWLDSLK